VRKKGHQKIEFFAFRTPYGALANRPHREVFKRDIGFRKKSPDRKGKNKGDVKGTSEPL